MLEQLSIYFRRMTGKLTDAGTHPLPGVLGKRCREIQNSTRLADPVRWACRPDASELTSRAGVITTDVPRLIHLISPDF
ncbi:MAG TPA: hypothetical protein VE863_20570 [Pyrinomonadaceae bacterium]|nr:hypothetical protein [Pyrinomonadaceae bacterium]